jgi:putative sterol carrier protein
MADVTAEFFEQLGARGHEPLLGTYKGTLRWDFTDGTRTESWLVVIERGDVTVSRSTAGADCVARTDKALFDGLARGEANALAAVIRGAITFEGNPELLVAFQGLFPGPPQKRRRAAARRKR